VVALAGNLLFNQNERTAFRFADLVRSPRTSDTTRLSVGSPLVNGRVYAPHAARVRVKVADSVTAEWTNQLTLGDSGGRPVMRWVTRGTRYQPGRDPIRWSILQTYDAVTLAPYGYRSTSTTGAEWQLVIQGRRVVGTRKLPGDTAMKPVEITLGEPGFIASASDLVPLAAGLRAGAVMTAPVWGPALADSELRIFSVLGRVPVDVEGSRVEAWKVEERRARDNTLVATWYLTEQSPYMVYGEVPLPDGRTQTMTEVAIPQP
jgi:hypothetical protein